MYRKHCAPAVQPGQVSDERMKRESSADYPAANPAGRVQAPPAVHIVHAEVQASQR